MTETAATLPPGMKAAEMVRANGGDIVPVPPSGAFSGFDFGFRVPETNTTHYIRDNGDGTITHGMEQDLEPILDMNHAWQTAGDHGWSKSKDLRRIGTIPHVIAQDLKNNHNLDIHSTDPDQQRKLKRFFNDGDFKRLRTAEWEV